MTAPFAPDLNLPVNKGGVGTGTMTFSAKFKTVTPGDAAASYQLRRRQMAPTIGSYEYWNATTSAWVASAVDNTLTAATYYDNNTVNVSASPGTAGSTYQWSMLFKNGAAEASVYANDMLYQTHAAPTMTMTVPTTNSRPRVRWVANVATTFFMRSYQLAAYTVAVTASPGFNPSLPAWQAQATYLTVMKYSGSDYYHDPTVDFASGTSYAWYYKIEDNSGLSSGWVSGVTAAMSFTSPQAPGFNVTPDIINGNVGLAIRSAFNLVPESSSTFPTSNGTWRESLNADANWDPTRVAMRVTSSGMSYQALDAAVGTYTNLDTTYTTYAVQQATQVAPTLTTRVVSGVLPAELYTANPNITYSAICDIYTQAIGRNASINILWYKANGTVSTVNARSVGPATALSPGATTQVRNFNVTSPSDAGLFALEVEFTSPPIGESFCVDNVAAATAASVQWSPGSLVDVSFVVEKTKDGGKTWEAVWGCSRANPRPSDIGVLTQIILNDRAPYLSVAAWQYRAYAISNFTTTPIWSAPTVIDGPIMAPDHWWLKNTLNAALDVQPKFSAMTESTDISDQTYVAENAPYPIFVASGDPDVTTYDVTLVVLNKSDHERLISSLASKCTLYIQTNLEGIGYYVRPSSRRGKRQIKSTADTVYGRMRSAFEVTFQATLVATYEG